LPFRLSPNIADHESLTRFLFSGEHFAETKGLVKWKAFIPDERGETSVFRLAGAKDREIWQIGNSIRTIPTKARGDFLSSFAHQVGLNVKPAIEEHPRHAVMSNWPVEKHLRLHIATQLSSKTTLRMPPA